LYWQDNLPYGENQEGGGASVMLRRAVRWWATVAAALLLGSAARAQTFPLVPIETGVPVELTVPVRRGDAFRPERVTATLFEAALAKPAPAAVIINSSGGVIAHTELFWGRLLARIIHRTARNRPRPPNSWARDFIAKNFIKQPIRIVVNDINGLALIAHFS